MTSNRVYVYGINKEGCAEFLHTFLDKRDAEAYIDNHKKIFGERFENYIYGTALEMFNQQEV